MKTFERGVVGRHSFYEQVLPAPAARAGSDRTGDIIDLRDVVIRLWAGRWAILATIAATVCSAYIAISQMQPEFRAEAQMLFGANRANIVDLQQVLTDPTFSKDTLQNEVEILRSTTLLNKVIADQALDREPEINPALRPPSPGLWARTDAALRRIVTTPWAPPAAEVTETDPQRAHLVMIETLRRKIALEPVTGSQVITIAVTAGSPELAARIANGVTGAYIDTQLQEKRDTARAASDWLASRVAEMRQKVQATEEAVETLRGRLAAEAGQSLSVTELQLQSLAVSLTEERKLRDQFESEATRLRAMIEAGTDLATVDSFREDPVIADLLTQIAALDRRDSRLAESFAPDHPARAGVRGQIDALTADMYEAADLIVAARAGAAASAAAREREIAANLQAMEAQAAAQSRDQVRLREAEREAEASRLIYENFLTRLKETSIQEELQAPDARILSRAEPPLGPHGERTQLVLLLSAAAGTVLGIGFILLGDAVNTRFRTPRTLEEFAGYPLLSALPTLGKRKRRRAVVDELINDPRSNFAEAIRNLRTSILMRPGGPPPRIVMFTSSLPREGKTTTAALLGMASQKMGRPSIIVDCDLRVPSLSALIPRADERPGIVSVLTGKSDWRTAVHSDPATGLHLLTARLAELPREVNAADILSGPGFRNLLSDLAAHYELIVLDTPPTLAVTDARILAGVADAVVYAVRWNKTSRGAVLQGLRELHSVQAPIAGVVMTMMDPAKAELYAYDGYRYDRGRYGAYSA